MFVGYVTPAIPQPQCAQAASSSRAASTAASPQACKKGVINKALKRHGSDTTKACALNLMGVIDQVQDKRGCADEFQELLPDIETREAERPTSW